MKVQIPTQEFSDELRQAIGWWSLSGGGEESERDPRRVPQATRKQVGEFFAYWWKEHLLEVASIYKDAVDSYVEPRERAEYERLKAKFEGGEA